VLYSLRCFSLIDTNNPLVRQLCSKKKAKIYVVSGVGTIKGDSTLVYRINRDIGSETSVSIPHGNGYNPVYKF